MQSLPSKKQRLSQSKSGAAFADSNMLTNSGMKEGGWSESTPSQTLRLHIFLRQLNALDASTKLAQLII